MSYTVYKHTNQSNGMSYIGVTGRNPERRWKHGNGYSRHPKFFEAITEDGWDAFSHEILAVCSDIEEAFEIEKSMIDKYDSFNNGYNATRGGYDMELAFERLPVDKYDLDTGELICTYPSVISAAKDVGITDSHISECCKGKHSTAGGYGWAYHDEPYSVPKKCVRYAKIEQVDPDTGNVLAVYASQKEAADAIGVSKSLINLCCKGRQRTGAGYIWRYAR